MAQPIRVGDRFADSRGAEWCVIETRPGGHVSLFNRARSSFLDTYKRDLRTERWSRLASSPVTPPEGR